MMDEIIGVAGESFDAVNGGLKLGLSGAGDGDGR